MEVTAHQLKELDPKQFEEEYRQWTKHAAGYEWWDFIEEGFKESCKPMGIDVTRICFDDYPWNAQFTGRVDVSKWMKHCKLDEKWYPLWLALDADSAYVRVVSENRRHGRLDFEWCENIPYSTPIGVFADMPQEEWLDMLEHMWVQADLHTELKDFLHGLCQDLAHDLEKDYDHETSEETFLDSCECNEVTFTYEGDEDEIQS